MATNIDTEAARAALEDTTLQEELLEDELDEYDVPAHIREARMAAFAKQMAAVKEAKELGGGELTVLEDEKQLFHITTTVPRVICHFFHPDFRRCAIMTSHLRDLAKRHFTTRFVAVNGETAPFLAQKLKITELPTVLCFIDGVVKEKIVGFEVLGNSDNFTTKELELRLSMSKVISIGQASIPSANGSIFGHAGPRDDESDED
eukprot:TRINITY_DN7020_c0_g1_i2.p1 TRINITY_DN7020_c0_g1~~TRINITY_DN7020_c0_g1_i2.p1  ORF type:complete len:204 (+),score=50.63 TRINITY_DN7020_c0_g1_i2:58-669(+)